MGITFDQMRPEGKDAAQERSSCMVEVNTSSEREVREPVLQ